jgi:hypothetical protein
MTSPHGNFEIVSIGLRSDLVDDGL